MKFYTDSLGKQRHEHRWKNDPTVPWHFRLSILCKHLDLWAFYPKPSVTVNFEAWFLEFEGLSVRERERDSIEYGDSIEHDRVPGSTTPVRVAMAWRGEDPLRPLYTFTTWQILTLLRLSFPQTNWRTLRRERTLESNPLILFFWTFCSR